jgi:glucan phosphoethanolaminetransferase (alkaline phosphatase superfamily)
MTTSYDDLPRQTSTVERVVTILLMIALAVLVPLASFFGLFFGMASDGCVGDTRCSSEQITVGIVISAGSPWVVYLAALAVVIVRWVRRRRTWWVPIAALLVGAALWALGGFVAVSGVG